MDRYFVMLLLDQLKKGNKICNPFKKQAWNDMLMLFNGKFGSKYEKSYCLSTWLLVFIFTVFSCVQLLM